MGPTSLMVQVQELNLFTLPLKGRTLIEASAGTGKTYSLAFIYLRLLLGIGEESECQPLMTNQILVVTFTKAATEELRYRIRQNIHQLRLACIRGEHLDPAYQRLIEIIDTSSLGRQQAIERLTDAEQTLDDAAIFTIHGFCQRILSVYALESGILFKQNLVKDETDLYLKVVRDFWRSHFNPMPQKVAEEILSSWQDPETLLADIRPYLNSPLPTNVQSSNSPLFDSIINIYQQNGLLIQALKDAWRQSSAALASIIAQSDVNKRSYSKSTLPKWVNIINIWAESDVLNYSLPPELIRFSQAELNNKTAEDKQAPEHPIFTQIEQLIDNKINFRERFMFDIIKIIQQNIDHEKSISAQMGFNDLLIYLNQALQGQHGLFLAQQIVQQYPVALIDEFQDTDPIQYQIFDTIYQDHNDSALLLIGDPKQAIYGFRGADIFTYITAKFSVDYHYTMLTNWRSSLNMVAAVNELFCLQTIPFIFDAIPFIEMHASTKNQHKNFYVEQKKQSGLNFYIMPETITSSDDYLNYSAHYCAEQIANWLSGECYFCDESNQLPSNLVTSADIAILVRTGREAEIIQQQLNYRNIKSVYLSNHHSVFASQEARELLRILSAILTPTNLNHLRSALATRILDVNMQQLAELVDDQEQVEIVLEEFREYQLIWLNTGILVMLRRLMKRRHLGENLLAHQDGERIMTNLMHLGELLQEISLEVETPHALLRWLVNQINQPDNNLENHEQRLESDENLVKIVTIHKSKGLEYPIVCLPFIATYRSSSNEVYHDKHGQTIYAFEKTDDIKALLEQERLAEDLRLLYVALTRSIYHCMIGIAGIKKGNSKKMTLIDSAIGKLLLQPEDDYQALVDKLNNLTYASTKIIEPSRVITSINTKQTINTDLQARKFGRKLDTSWRVTSYSGLQQSSLTIGSNNDYRDEIMPLFDAEALSDHQTIDNDFELSAQYDIYQFPKGALVGTLLHESFETLNFENPNIISVVDILIARLNLVSEWQQPLFDWFEQVLRSPLDYSGLCLKAISQTKRINELQFYLPIRQPITAMMLDQITKQYDPLSAQCSELNFETVQGMLKGFIDMIFEWQGKYYIVDYKSNYLGETVTHYEQHVLESAICEHRYDLQYQLYTLALHRYLKSRLVDYDYQQHFGGVFYLFLRGMNGENSKQGIFYTKPEQSLIDELDQLFG